MLTDRPADILMTDDGRLVAVRARTGELMLSSNRIGRFTAERWLQRDGQRQTHPWPAEGENPDGWLRCDSLGCLYRPHGRTIAIILDPNAIAEDCRQADVVLSAVPRYACRVRPHTRSSTGSTCGVTAVTRSGSTATRCGLKVSTAGGVRGRGCRSARIGRGDSPAPGVAAGLVSGRLRGMRGSGGCCVTQPPYGQDANRLVSGP